MNVFSLNKTSLHVPLIIIRKKIADAIFPNHLTPQSLHFPATFTFIPHNPFGMVFAPAAVSAAQKPCQPFQGQGIYSNSLISTFYRYSAT